MSFGVTDTGFNRMLESDLKAAIVQDWAPLFEIDPTTNDWPSTDTPESQFLDPFCRQLGIAWEALAVLAMAGDPNQAFGTLLDAVLFLNNTKRREATKTLVLAAISGTEGTVVPAGRQASVQGLESLFASEQEAEITKDSLLRVNLSIGSVSDLGTPYSVTINGGSIGSGALDGTPNEHTIAYQVMKAVNAASDVVEAVLSGSAVLRIETVANSQAYVVTINGTAYSYTSDASALESEIMAGIISAINSGQSAVLAEQVTSSTFSLTPSVTGKDWTFLVNYPYLWVQSLSPAGEFSIKAADLVTPFSFNQDSRIDIEKLFSPQYFAAVATGPVAAPAGTLRNIETPVSGWQAVTNFLDGVLGQDVESDDDARIRREDELSTGNSIGAAIKSRVLKVPGVSLVRVYENILDSTDSEGRPGHSVEVLVQGGDDQEVAQAVWDSRAFGIRPYGNINSDGTIEASGPGSGIEATDSNGDSVTVHFSRPENLYCFVTAVKTTYDEEDVPEEVDQAIEDAILEFGNKIGIGKDLKAQRFIGPCVSIPGVGGVALQFAVSDDPDDPSPSYGSGDIVVSSRQVLVFDSSRISVS